jgi:hypothetical protein
MQIAKCKLSIAESSFCNLQFAICNLQFLSPLGLSDFLVQ